MSTASIAALFGTLYMMFSTTHLPFSGSRMKSMNLCAASWFFEAWGMTMVSTQRSLPSLGITYLIAAFSAMP